MRVVLGKIVICMVFLSFGAGLAEAFEVDTSPQPPDHPPLTPEDGQVVAVNPPPMIWRVDDRAATYTLQLSRDERFSESVIEIRGIDMPFYNHSEVLAPGTWYWRYYVIDDKGQRSEPGPVRRFIVPDGAVKLPVPPTRQILARMPGHPRIFTTPDTLEAFRERRHGVAAQAWVEVKYMADLALKRGPDELNLEPLDSSPPEGPTPGRGPWKPGDPTRRQVIWLVDGKPFIDHKYDYGALARAAGRANRLSFAYLISGDSRYAEAARDLLLFVADARLDYHLTDTQRASHDTVVFAYEDGLKFAALTYDRIYDLLSAEEREKVLRHIEYHADAAYRWLRDVEQVHLNFQRSHPFRCMNALLPTVLAIANDNPRADEWADYLVRQYVNRIAYANADGGFIQGQTYAYQFRYVLESIAAIRTACGLDLFQTPRIAHAGDFWLYAMSLNYWYHHNGDVFSLLYPWGSPSDGFISGLLAAMMGNPYVQWWSDTVYTDPVHLPFQYLSSTELAAVPPIDIPQARVFPETGQVAAYDRFYDHLSNRIFFRSSPWGGQSHAHADQNSFVIHAGGEILAADTGYYTYYDDDYHAKWSVTTNVHNSILIEQKGQPKGVEYKGRITGFFHAPRYTFFAGDASEAYEAPMERFERAILFIRPNVYVVYDELKAEKPSEFSWLLNTFQAAEIDSQQRRMVVPQQHMRLQVDHLRPRYLRYSQSNERRYPMLTRDWTRFTEAFPEPWHIRVSNTLRQEDLRFLTLMSTYDVADGPGVEAQVTIDEPHTVGMQIALPDQTTETVLFRRYLDQHHPLAYNGLESDARMVSVGQAAQGRVDRWVIIGAKRLAKDGRVLFASEQPAQASAEFNGPAGGGLFWIDADQAQRIQLYMPERPDVVLHAPPHNFPEARALDFEWDQQQLTINWPGGRGVLWVDPAVAPDRPVPEVTLRLEDSVGTYELALQTRMAENGQWVAYGQFTPREPGTYSLSASDDVELLIQDYYDIARSARGRGKVAGPLRAKTEVFVRFNPQDTVPQVVGRLDESYQGRIINYVRNGSFEEGVPGYPPRGWTVLRELRENDVGWPGWSQEDAVSGKSSLKFVRPHGHIAARAQPMRLPADGIYHLRFYARGNATKASVRVDGARGTGGGMAIEPSDDWQVHEKEFKMAAGYCEIRFDMGEGGDPDQVLWIDDLQFGPVGQINHDMAHNQ